MTKYILYIDDSGTKEFATAGQLYGKGVSRYFVFCGILISTANAGILTSEIIQLKLNYFGTDVVEIKSNWLRNPNQRQLHYLDQYEISDEQLSEFSNALYEIIQDKELLILASIIDKIHLEEDYQHPWYPPAIAYELLLQRAESEIHGKGEINVIIDDMTGKTPHGNPYKTNLLKQHENLKQKGSVLYKGFPFCCVKGRLKFANSAYSSLIQLADIFAYDVYRQFRDYGVEWEQRVVELPMYEYFAKLVPKIRKSKDGTIQGYGIVKFPPRNRIYWSINESAVP